MPLLWPGLPALGKRLVAIGAALLFATAAAVGMMIADMRNVALVDARANLGKLGIAVAEQTTRAIQTLDVALNEITREIAAQGIDAPDRFHAVMATYAVHAALESRVNALPQAHAFVVIGADGMLVNASRLWPIPYIDLADRDFFERLKIHDDGIALMGEAVQSRLNGNWVLTIARRVNGPDGAFLGVVLATLNLAYFQDFFGAVTIGGATTVNLVQRDATMLASYPVGSQVGEVQPVMPIWREIVASRMSGSYVGAGISNPGQRIVSVHPLRDYPLVVNLSVGEWDSLANWRRAAILAAIGTACAALCIGLLLRALARQLQSLETTTARSEAQAAELQESEARLAAQSATLRTTLNNMNQGIMMVDADRVVQVCNNRAKEMLDLPPDLFKNRLTLDQIVIHQHAMGEFQDLDAPPTVGLAQLSTKPSGYERRRPNGTVLEILTVPLPNGGMVRTYTDITSRRKAEEQVRYFAHHDDLTKLVNRMVFQTRLDHAIDFARQSSRSVAVLYLDLDRFKLVNDTRGHGTGDALLAAVAERLRGAIRGLDTVARMGGDEFAIIQPLAEAEAQHTGPDSAPARLAQRLQDQIAQPFEIDGQSYGIGVSIGIAQFPQHAANAVELLRNADIALYRAKAEGRGVWRMFDEHMDFRQQQRSQLEHELLHALALDQFELEYQPVVDLATGRIVCCEALLRWRHQTRGLVPPADFIALAESCGQIAPIGIWVLEQACAEAASWPAPVEIAVNLSPAQFYQDGLIDALTAILARTGLPPARLILEVTEGVLLKENGAVVDTMAKVRAMGVRFSLDDFGTDHAGLSYLTRFVFDAIKIDKSFVHDLADQPGATAIVSAVLNIGAAMGLRVIAEGVETEAQLDAVRRLGCRHVQGYLTGAPLPPEANRRRLPEAAVSS